MMNENNRQAITQRLVSSAGHIKGIERMVHNDAYCIDVIKQIQAVQAALYKVSAMILDAHLHSCVTAVIQGDCPVEREQMLAEVASVFDLSNRLGGRETNQQLSQ